MKIFWPRGKVLGGSSAIDLYQRSSSGFCSLGTSWGQRLVLEEVLPYYKKAEAQQTHKDDFAWRRRPLYVEDVRERQKAYPWTFTSGCDGIHRAFQETPTLMGKTKLVEVTISSPNTTAEDGSMSTAYLSSAKKRKNLKVISRAKAEKIIFEQKKATALQIRKNGSIEQIDAEHIILSGGSINSPQLLELSGIGDAERLHTLGLPVVHNNPDVGEHLQDHLLSKVVYGTQPSQSINREVQGLRLIPTVMKMAFSAARSIDHRFGARGRFLVHKRRIGGSRYSNSFRFGCHAL